MDALEKQLKKMHLQMIRIGNNNVFFTITFEYLIQ